MSKNKDSGIVLLGNVVGGGKAQGGKVYDTKGNCPSLLAGMTHGNTVPYVVTKCKKNK